MSQARCIAITGLGNPLADGLAARLLEAGGGSSVVAVGTRLPVSLRGRLELHPLDPGDPADEAELAAFLTRRSVDAVAHLPFEPAPGEVFEGEAGWLARAAANVGHASARAGVARLVVASSTMCYGARPQNPNFLDEDCSLFGHPDSPWLGDQCAAEESLARLALAHPGLDVCVLRHPWVMGPDRDDAITRYFAGMAIPVPIGRDPLLQFVHECDLLDVCERSVLEAHPGVFNVVADAALPLSRLLALAGKRGLPMPAKLLRSAPRVPCLGTGAESPEVFFDYLRYLWVADGRRARAEFGAPLYTTQEAWIAFASARRKAWGVADE